MIPNFQKKEKPTLVGENKRFTKEFFKKLLRSDPQNYYSVPNLNEVLYIHYLGAERIECLEEFTDLRVIYLEGNCISEIEGLDNQEKLRCLYLHENLIKKIENLGNQEQLVSLNLSDNLISKIENLHKNPNLESLQLKRNRIGINGLSDISELARYKKLSSLDLSNNYIDCENWEDFVKVFEQMDSLAVLYLQNNPIINKIPNYRKTMVARLKGLKYLDDRPVFDEDRRFAEAFYHHGPEAERQERKKFKEEEEEKHLRNHLAFKQMLYANRREANPERENQDANSMSEHTGRDANDSHNTSQLETYESENSHSKKVDESLSHNDSMSVKSENLMELKLEDLD